MRSRIACIVAAFSLPAVPAAACSCVVSNTGGCVVPTADMIVLATVVSKEVIQNGPPAGGAASLGDSSNRQTRCAITAASPLAPIVKITLNISERFRGNSGNSVVVQTDTSDCAYPFEVGHEYLVFANESQGNLTVTTCSATQPAQMAIARIFQLRALGDKTPLPSIFGSVGTSPLRRDPTGWEQVRPMPGLTVTARSDSAEYRTQTADDGLYAFQGLPSGRYQLSVAAPPGRRAFWGGSAERPGASPGIPCAMNFEVFWDGLISGTVLGGDGQPASGMITAQYIGPETLPAGPFGGQVKDGRFEIPRLPPGRYRLMFLPIVAGRPPGPAIYYPGTQVPSSAALIEVGEGAHVDGLQFTIF